MNKQEMVNKVKATHLSKYAGMYTDLEALDKNCDYPKVIAESRQHFYEDLTVELYEKYEEHLNLANILADCLILGNDETIYATQTEYAYIIETDGENIYFNAWNPEETVGIFATDEGFDFVTLLSEIIESTKYDHIGSYFKRLVLTDF